MAIEFSPRLNDANPDPRVACALLLDVSGSMEGDKITELRNGLRTFCSEVAKDPLARKRTEVLLVTFGGQVNVVQDFTEARDLVPPTLVAGGTTPLGPAILTALERIEARKTQYKDAGLEYFRRHPGGVARRSGDVESPSGVGVPGAMRDHGFRTGPAPGTNRGVGSVDVRGSGGERVGRGKPGAPSGPVQNVVGTRRR